MAFFDDYGMFWRRMNPPMVSVDNSSNPDVTLVKVHNDINLEISLKVEKALRDLNLTIIFPLVCVADVRSPRVIYVVDQFGNKLSDEVIQHIEQLDLTHPPLSERKSERSLMSWAPGYKFQPDDGEIIVNLENKHSNPCEPHDDIKDCTDFCRTEPWHLPGANRIKEKKALYFYVLTKMKSGNGDRSGPNGFWKATGINKILSETGSEIGYRRTLKYHEYPDDENRRSSKFGKPTNWMMHEYGLAATSSQSQDKLFKHWTICKIIWTGKNIQVLNNFSREGSVEPSKMVVQQNLSCLDCLDQECLSKYGIKMHYFQNEGDLKISKIVDPKQEENARTNYHSKGDELGSWTLEKRAKFRELRMNEEARRSEGITLCNASGIHSTPSTMATTQVVETGGVEPQQFETPERITEKFEPFISGQTSDFWVDCFLNPDFIGMEDGKSIMV